MKTTVYPMDVNEVRVVIDWDNRCVAILLDDKYLALPTEEALEMARQIQSAVATLAKKETEH